MDSKVLLITPPFTQLNTPYPATAYLKGFLNTKGIESFQADLGIETILQLFSEQGLAAVFEEIEDCYELDELPESIQRTYHLRAEYLSSIHAVIAFLQHRNPTLAHSICSREYLPEGDRFKNIEDTEWAFGSMGIQDKARHYATLYMEDLGDMITYCTDEHFGFSRYAERLGRTASDFFPLQEAVEAENSLISDILEQLLQHLVEDHEPDVVCISVPFPGNLFGALKCGQYLRKVHPDIKVIMGGGYANTELRSLSDERIFDFVDYICLDDGEAPLLFLLEYIEGKREASELKRVFMLTGGVVSYYNNALEKDVAQREVGCPDYRDLLLKEYLSVIEIVNPMHRLWSDGRWNKMTLAHGCYWGKCSFCDISLDYIQRYEPVTADILCDRIEEIMEQTGENGFHFVDEAAPPALMRDLAIEILKRKLTVVWWTNIRFEKTFSADLCRLLKASGCIAVSGGLEVASDRLLKLMKKGVTVAQVAKVCQHFTDAGIMVHAYLMYGFPTETAEETIDSLEMVRQLFEQGVLQSGFWHQFAMTAHSPVGLAPQDYKVAAVGPEFMGFADNDLYHEDPEGADHEKFSEGLKTSLFNYMHGAGFELELSQWFDFESPATAVPKNYIQKVLKEGVKISGRKSVCLWIGGEIVSENKNSVFESLKFYNKKEQWSLDCQAEEARIIFRFIRKIIESHPPIHLSTIGELFSEKEKVVFEQIKQSDIWVKLQENGLLIL